MIDELSGNHPIDLVACTLFNVNTLVDLAGCLTVSSEICTFSADFTTKQATFVDVVHLYSFLLVT